MPAPLIAILDETGTSNRPQVASDTDFAVGGFLVEEATIGRLRAISHEIGEAVGNSDYK